MKAHSEKHLVSFILVGSIVTLIITGAVYYLASQKRIQNAQVFQQQEVAAAATQAQKDYTEAESFVNGAEASIAALRMKSMDVSALEVRLDELKVALQNRRYEAMSSGFAEVASESAKIGYEDEVLVASLSARLVNLQIKYEDYDKQGVKVATLAGELASASGYLERRKFDEARSYLTNINSTLDKLLTIKKVADKQVAEAVRVSAVPVPIAAQSNGGVTYERKVVNTSSGGFTADILTVDMSRVKVKTFTANDNDCSADCPVKPLASYVSENGGIAGINGTYFCPPDYSQCAGTKNSFNTLVFDHKSKKYMNSSQNQYSVNPLISFYNGSAHFYTQALGYGRDTSANGVISNHPTLMYNGGVATNPNLDAKSSSRGLRCGLGFRDKTLWALCVRGVTVNESALVYQALGAQHAMNLDGGGSAALYFGGYKIGPGRLLPNAVVFTN